MSYPQLYRGSTGEEVKTLQLYLNRIGAMLIADGDFGGGTVRGVMYAQDVANMPVTGNLDAGLWSWLAAQPDPFPQLATNGIAFIALEETGGLDYYQTSAHWPCYPGGLSGVTIGVGFDLGANSEQDFRDCWGPYLSPGHIRELSKDIGKRGTPERVAELRQMGVDIPFKVAWAVFIKKNIPKYYTDTKAIYPSLEQLPELCRSVLVSIVYNRGASLREDDDKRKEMRMIRDILLNASASGFSKEEKKKILSGVEDQIVAMKRLWAPSSGLCKRRQNEANLWRQGLNDW